MGGVVYRSGQIVPTVTRSGALPAARSPAPIAPAAALKIVTIADVQASIRSQIETAERRRYREVLFARAAAERLDWEKVQRMLAGD